jgi:tRNA(adenine34) deaminase
MNKHSRLTLIITWGALLLAVACSRPPSPQLATQPQGAEPRKSQFDIALAETGCGIDPALEFRELLKEIGSCIALYKSRMTPGVIDKFPDEPFGLITVEEAFEAVSGENFDFGIGSALFQGPSLLVRGHNSQLSTKRSDYHGEMVVLNAYEDAYKELQKEDQADLLLFTSAEPCPMCFTRIIIAGVPAKYVTSIDGDGMVAHKDGLPKEWKEVAQGTPITRANCSPKLQALAKALFLIYTKL